MTGVQTCALPIFGYLLAVDSYHGRIHVQRHVAHGHQARSLECLAGAVHIQVGDIRVHGLQIAPGTVGAKVAFDQSQVVSQSGYHVVRVDDGDGTQIKKDMLSLPFPAPNFYKGFNPLKAGNFAMSPIHIKDVASIFVKSIEEISLVKKTYCLGGDTYYWQDIIKIISSAYGKKKWTIPAPAIIIQGFAFLFDQIGRAHV